MHRTVRPQPHHLRNAACIVAVRLVDLRFHLTHQQRSPATKMLAKNEEALGSNRTLARSGAKKAAVEKSLVLTASTLMRQKTLVRGARAGHRNDNPQVAAWPDRLRRL
jgi:hypothetical protein